MCQVYSCEYQFLAAVYTDDRGLVTPEEIPFWPAPDNAPGGCGCNFGQLYFNYTDAISQGIGICAVEGRISADTESGCTCCAESAAVSAYVFVVYVFRIWKSYCFTDIPITASMPCAQTTTCPIWASIPQ